jgi:hypothetical protein
MGVDNVSHGCISLSPTDAEWYFNNVHIGDPVIVKEGVPAVDSEKEADVKPAQPSTLDPNRPAS